MTFQGPFDHDGSAWWSRPHVPFPDPLPVPPTGIFDPPTLCMIVNEQWVKYLLGALDTLDQRDTWEGSPEVQEAARNQIRELMASLASGEGCLMVDPCCPETNELLIEINTNNQLIIERNEFNAIINRYQNLMIANQEIAFQLQILQDRDDPTNYRSFAPDAPDLSFSQDSTDSTPELVSGRAAALCSAVDRYVEHSAYVILNVANAGLVGAGALGGFLGAAATAAGVAFFPIGLLVGAAVGVAAAIWNGAMSDPEGRRKVKCCMYDNLLGQTISFEVFQECIADCGFDPSSSEGVIAGAINRVNHNEANYRGFVAMLGGEMSTLAPGGVANQCDCSCGVPTVQIGTIFNHGDSSYTLTSIDYTAEHAAIYGNPERIGWPFLRWEVPGCCQILMGQVVDEGTGGSLLGYWEACDDTVHPDTPGVFYPPEGEDFKMALAYRANPDSNHFSIKVLLGGS